MKYIITTICCFLVLNGCSNNNEHPLDIGLMVSSGPHKIVIWINNEPLAVSIPSARGVLPIRLLTQKGENNIWIIAENKDDIEGITNIQVLEGSRLKPESIVTHLDWSTSKSKDKSPVFKIHSDNNYFPKLSEFEKINLTDNEAKRIIYNTYEKVLNALKNKNISEFGYSEKEMDYFGKRLMNIDGYAAKVFGAKDYKVSAKAEPQDLGYIIGEKVLMVFNNNGRGIFEVTSQVNESKQVKKRYGYGMDSFAMCKKDNAWQLIFPFKE